MIQVVAELSGAQLTTNVTSEASKAASGAFPYLQTSDGSIISEAEAVAKHVARLNSNNKLLGKNAFEEAKINEWISWVQSDWNAAAVPAVEAVYGTQTLESAAFSEAVKEVKVLGKMLDGYLKGKQWLVGDSISLGDLYLGASLAPAFQTILDAGFRKAHPDLSEWFERWSKHHPVVKRHGAIHACQKALKPLE
jgi:elongation factor 1-gamma